jgi:hypothetical protein
MANSLVGVDAEFSWSGTKTDGCRPSLHPIGFSIMASCIEGEIKLTILSAYCG